MATFPSKKGITLHSERKISPKTFIKSWNFAGFATISELVAFHAPVQSTYINFEISRIDFGFCHQVLCDDFVSAIELADCSEADLTKTSQNFKKKTAQICQNEILQKSSAPKTRWVNLTKQSFTIQWRFLTKCLSKNEVCKSCVF